LQKQLALANGEGVRTINPLPILDGTGEGGNTLLAGWGSDGNGGSTLRLGPLPTNAETVGAIDTESGQETPDTTHGFEGFEVLEVDEGREVVRLENAKGVGSIFSSWVRTSRRWRHKGARGEWELSSDSGESGGSTVAGFVLPKCRVHLEVDRGLGWKCERVESVGEGGITYRTGSPVPN